MGFSLSGGERRRVEIARALATKPMVMLVDEVMAGLNPVEIDRSIKLLKEIREEGIFTQEDLKKVCHVN